MAGAIPIMDGDILTMDGDIIHGIIHVVTAMDTMIGTMEDTHPITHPILSMVQEHHFTEQTEEPVPPDQGTQLVFPGIRQIQAAEMI